MKTLLIIFAIIFIFLKIAERYYSSDLEAYIKLQQNKGSFILGLLTLIEWILGAIIIIKIILTLFN